MRVTVYSPLGEASIASGCTPVACLLGALPQTPVARKEHIDMKSERFNLRMTPKEKQALHAKAKTAKMPVSQFLIAAAFDKEINIIDGLPELTSELKCIGRNLNQLTTLANMGRVQTVALSDFTAELTAVLSTLRQLIREVD